MQRPYSIGSQSDADPPHILRLRGGRATLSGQRLLQLQFVMKKDPGGYASELQAQEKNFQNALRAWEESPNEPHKELGELVVFLAHVMPSYKEKLAGFPAQLMGFIRKNYETIERDTRLKLCSGLTLLCARHLFPVEDMCNLFFTMFSLQDKKLRAYLYSSCLNAIKRANARSVDQTMNRAIQRELSEFLHGLDGPSGRLAIEFFVEMYRRRMWVDDHAVNIIGAACFSRLSKVRGTAISFLLGSVDEEDDEENDDFGIRHGGEKEAKKVKVTRLLTAKKHKKKAIRKALKKQKMEEERLKKEGKESKKDTSSFSVLDQLHDPQSFAEKILTMLQRQSGRLTFDHKLLMMELISRLVGSHRLILIEYFDWLKRYMTPKQVLCNCGNVFISKVW